MRLFVGNLPYEMTDAELEHRFGQFGVVVDTKIMRTPSGESKGIGFVTMRDSSAGVAAVRAGAFSYGGRMLYIRDSRREGAPRLISDPVTHSPSVPCG
jgi:RNA recognition motif-containing protein